MEPIIDWLQELEDEDLGDHFSVAINSAVFGGNDANQASGQVHFKYDAETDTILRLSARSSNGTLSFVEDIDGVAYQVPTGKKAVGIVYMTNTNETATRTAKVRSSTTVDTANGTILHDQTRVFGQVLPAMTAILEWIADRFITVEQVSAPVGGGTLSCHFIGYETDA